jgi:hypothetical protein
MAISLNFKGFNASLKGPMSMVLAVLLTVFATKFGARAGRLGRCPSGRDRDGRAKAKLRRCRMFQSP